MSATYDEIVAEQQAAKQRGLEATRRRATLFTLESVDTDGFPRVSAYTVEHLVGRGLIEKVPGDNLGRYQLTSEGRIVLAANPAERPTAEAELALFGVA